MSTSIKGTYRDGKVELQELPKDIEDETPVIVTFPSPNRFDLQEHGINEALAAELQAALVTFEDWKLPEMAIYDDYDGAKAKLQTR
jgi:hypothetical protein